MPRLPPVTNMTRSFRPKWSIEWFLLWLTTYEWRVGREYQMLGRMQVASKCADCLPAKTRQEGKVPAASAACQLPAYARALSQSAMAGGGARCTLPLTHRPMWPGGKPRTV